MPLSIPQRYSPTWWLCMTTGVAWFGGLTAGALYWLGVFENPIVLVVAFLGGSIVGDIVLAIAFEAFAPSRVTLAPGEKRHRHDSLDEVATVVSGFDASSDGKVRIRGETWMARCRHDSALTLASGDRVRVLERDGLTLLIVPL